MPEASAALFSCVYCLCFVQEAGVAARIWNAATSARIPPMTAKMPSTNGSAKPAMTGFVIKSMPKMMLSTPKSPAPQPAPWKAWISPTTPKIRP